MKPKQTILHLVFTLCLFIIMFCIETRSWSKETVDNSIYADLLSKYVKNGFVDYKGFKDQEHILDQYLKVLEETKPKSLSHDKQFAFYINAYNAWTIKLILSGYPGLKSIKDLGSLFKSPWKKKLCRIDGKLLSLDDIEHDILRPQFKDPRIHFAVNCASKSCPPLRSEPYHGSKLDQQLNEMTIAFINDSEINSIDGTILNVSPIFSWYSEDFEEDVIGFFQRYANGDLKTEIDSNRSRIKIKYRDYDWSLNGK